jgi:hypothetical protein
MNFFDLEEQEAAALSARDQPPEDYSFSIRSLTKLLNQGFPY